MWHDDAEGVACRRCAAISVIDRDLGRHADAPELDEHGQRWPSSTWSTMLARSVGCSRQREGVWSFFFSADPAEDLEA